MSKDEEAMYADALEMGQICSKTTIGYETSESTDPSDKLRE